ncbi:hypothetical protein K3495_g1102 [Podosphaera aphanis]|nr:hypothetical protein K3495_g1102 [Podosphaera aphanis]
MGDVIPIILLKAKSDEHDAYEEVFSVGANGLQFEPTFVPVIEHKVLESGLDVFRTLLRQKKIGKGKGAEYHGLIFTSQRAVEAFAQLIAENRGDSSDHCTDTACLQGLPIYTVGPATTRALQAIPLDRPLNILGSESGNGENLARFIMNHQSTWHQDDQPTRGLLFVVGERRRDIIPQLLMDPNLGPKRILVTELEVYATSVRETFQQDFTNYLDQTITRPLRWVVLFSPTGSDIILRTLDVLDPITGHARARETDNTRRILVATIGPTTRDYLNANFGFVPDVCAAKPTSDSLKEGITQFLARENYTLGA